MLLEDLKVEKQIGGMEMRYLYKLTESEYMGSKVYGVLVSREYIEGEAVIDKYEDSIKYVSPIKEKVINLLNVLCKGEVSPIHLIDIAGEYVDNCVDDFCELEKLVG